MATRVCALILVGLYAWFCAAHGGAIGYFAPLDDFWGNAFQANTWAWRAGALWNGFFPPGYPTVLTLLPGPRLVSSAFYLNLACGMTLLVLAWATTRRLAGPVAGLAAMALVAAHPVVMTQVLTTGADALFVALAVAGALALFHATTGTRDRWGLALAAGVLLGASGWVRYHGFVFSAAALAAALVVGGTSWRRVVAAAVPVAIAGAGILVLGTAAGDLASMERAQAFNLYKGHVAAVNWFHLDAATLPTSVREAIARDPAAFWRSYLAFGTPHLWLLLPLVAAATCASGRARRFAIFAVVLGAVFVPVVNLGASPRGIAAIVPLVLMAAVLALAGVAARVPARRWRAAAAAGFALAAGVYAWAVWLPANRDYVASTRARAKASSDIETRLREDRVVFGAQVFTDNDFYLVHADGWQVATYHPRSIGGWPKLDMAGYLESYPEPSTDTFDRFLDDCLKVGVTHLVLTAAAGYVQADLGRLFDGGLTTARLTEVTGTPGVRIFRLVG